MGAPRPGGPAGPAPGAKPPEDKHVKFAEGIKQSEHKPAFVKHINKTRTMSAKQKWDWAFDKILQVGTKKLPASASLYLLIFNFFLHFLLDYLELIPNGYAY